MITKPHVSIWLDNRREKKDNKFPVKIRITHQRQRYYYPTNVDLTEPDFDRALSSKPGTKLSEIHFKLLEMERQSKEAIDKIADEMHCEFNIELFEKLLQIDSSDKNDVFVCFERKAQQLQMKAQIKTAVGYATALKAFQNYTGRKKLLFAEVDKRFLEGFEAYMLNQKKSLTTIGIYGRCLRTIFNEAIEDKTVSYELYPFGKNKYQVPQASNNKRALDEKDLIRLIEYKPEENSWEEYAKDMWTFSLLCQGMNMKDIANLRYKNIQGEKIIFNREKTKRTKRADLTPVVVYLSKDAQAIIKKWGHENTSPNQFVFPISKVSGTFAELSITI